MISQIKKVYIYPIKDTDGTRLGFLNVFPHDCIVWQEFFE